jgi:uncharacterized protein involved in propanediol utilization
MTIQITTYAKIGELLQGILDKNHSFLLSNHSSKYFKTMTVLDSNSKTNLPLKPKSRQALNLFWSTIEDQSQKADIRSISIIQESNIPEGKGLSSSSADILGVLSALNQFYNTHYSVEKLYQLATQIEPTDPCLHKNPLFFHQNSGEIIEAIELLPYSILYFDSDTDSQIDTLSFSQKVHYSENQTQEFQELIHSIKKATKTKDYELFFYCITKSAIINETILPKKNFPLLLDFASENNCGLFVAHSGTYMGLLIEPDRLTLIESKAKDFVAKHWETPLYIE